MATQSIFTPENLGTSWYGNVWLTLATLAYTDDASNTIVNVTADLPARVQSLAPMPPLQDGTPAPAGTWSVDWGPVYSTAVSSINANLMYIASYSVAGSRLFTAICIRGTDTSEVYTPGGLCTQLLEDLDVGHMVYWSDVIANTVNPKLYAAGPNLPAAIAHGSADAMADVLSFVSPATNCVGVIDYLSANVDPSVPIIVTGHSLGGCLATAMALYLTSALPGRSIVSHPFAPTTAGNQEWCTLYQNTLTNGQVWWNTADIVPNAFPVVNGNTDTNVASLTNISNMWGG